MFNFKERHIELKFAALPNDEMHPIGLTVTPKNGGGEPVKYRLAPHETTRHIFSPTGREYEGICAFITKKIQGVDYSDFIKITFRNAYLNPCVSLDQIARNVLHELCGDHSIMGLREFEFMLKEREIYQKQGKAWTPEMYTSGNWNEWENSGYHEEITPEQDPFSHIPRGPDPYTPFLGPPATNREEWITFAQRFDMKKEDEQILNYYETVGWVGLANICKEIVDDFGGKTSEVLQKFEQLKDRWKSDRDKQSIARMTLCHLLPNGNQIAAYRLLYQLVKDRATTIINQGNLGPRVYPGCGTKTIFTVQDKANYDVLEGLLNGIPQNPDVAQVKCILRKRREAKQSITLDAFRELITGTEIFSDFFKSEKLSEGREKMSVEKINPLVAAAQSRNPSKNMTASQLLSQTADVPLKRLVTRLFLDLAKDECWYRFLAAKGATGTEKADYRIQEARETGEPERFLIPEFCNPQPNYMVTEFLEDLRAIGGLADAAQAILLHLATKESTAQSAAETAIRLNSEIRSFIVDNELASDLSLNAVEYKLAQLKRYGVKSLADLKKMDEIKFSRCGFEGLYAVKAAEAAQRIQSSSSKK